MGSIIVDGIDEVIHKLEKLGDQAYVEEIAKKAVSQAAPLTESEMRAAIASAEHGPYSTGSVSESIKTTPAKVNAYGVFAVARPTGRDKKGVSNAAKAAFLQYGTPKLKARPWRQKAVNASLSPAKEAMEAVFKAEMELE